MNTSTHQDRQTDPAVKKLLFFGVFSLIIIIVGIFLGMSGAFTPDISAAVLEVSQTEYDFGDIDIFGGKVSTQYSLKNASDEEIIITGAKTTCMCTEGEIDGKIFGMHEGMFGEVSIAPGEMKTVKATFDPLAHGPDAVGPITRTLLLQTNSSAMGQIKLNFEGNVIKKEGSVMPMSQDGGQMTM